MERAPIPPHERSWRHPSELAAAQSAPDGHGADTSGTASRFLAMATGAVAATLVVVLAITVLPKRAPAPVAMSATTLPPFSVSAAAPVAASAVGAARDDPSSQVRLERTALASSAGLTLTGAPRSVAAPLVGNPAGTDTTVLADDTEQGRSDPHQVVHLITTSHVYRLDLRDLDRIIAPDGTLVVGDGGRIIGSFVGGTFVPD